MRNITLNVGGGGGGGGKMEGAGWRVRGGEEDKGSWTSFGVA